MISSKFLSFILVVIVVSACTSVKTFSLESNGNMPRLKVYQLNLSGDSLLLNATANMDLRGKYVRLLERGEQQEIMHKMEALNFEASKSKPLDGGRFYIIKYSRGKQNYSKSMTGFIPAPDQEFINFIETTVIKNAVWTKQN